MYKDIKINYTNVSSNFAKFSDVTLVSGDVNAYRIVFVAPWNLADCVFKIKCRRSDGTVISDIGATDGNTATYVMANSMHAVPGEITLQISLVKSDETVLTMYEISANVVEGFGDGVEAETLVPIIDSILMQIAEIKGDEEELSNSFDAHVNAAVLDHPDGSVTSAKIASGAITGEKIASGAITGGKIASDAVTRQKIANGAIITDKIADEAVTKDKLTPSLQDKIDKIGNIYEIDAETVDNVDSYYTESIVKLMYTGGSTGVPFTYIFNYYVPGFHARVYQIKFTELEGIKFRTCIDEDNTGHFTLLGAWENYVLYNGSVTTDKIADNAIIETKISSNAVTSAKIASGAVISGKIASGAVTSAKIADEAVTSAKIEPQSITWQKMAESSVGEMAIQSEAVTSGKIRDEAVTKQKLSPDLSNQIDTTKRSLDYLWKKAKGIIYDTETVTGNTSVVSVPSGAMEYAEIKKLGGKSTEPDEPTIVNKIISSGKNLFDKSQCLTRDSAHTITPTDDGLIYTGTFYFYLPFNAVINESYVFNANIVSQNPPDNLHTWRFQYLDGTYSSPVSFGTSFTPEKATQRVMIYPNYSSGDVATTEFSNMQLELGTSATEYKPYKEPTEKAVPSDLITYLSDKAYGMASSLSADRINHIDFENKKYIQWVLPDGTDLTEASEYDISSYLPDESFNILQVEAGGSISFEDGDGDIITNPVFSETEFIVKVFGEAPQTWADVQSIVKNGAASHYFDVGDQFVVEKLSGVTANIGTSTGITAATVTSATFIAGCGEVKSGDYKFTYDGKYWHNENGKTIKIVDYGIRLTGTPIAGDQVIITETTTNLTFDIIGIDHDTPADSTRTHSMTLQLHDLWSQGIAFDSAEAAFYIDESAYPDGLVSGTYNFTWDYATGSMIIGTYQFTLTQAVPAGGQIVIGTNSSSTALTDCKITTYSTVGSTTALESNIVITSGSGGTSLGTISTTSATATVNCAQRIMWGSNNWSESGMRQWLNTANAGNTWWVPKSVFDRPTSASSAGFLKDLDPAFLDVIGDVSKKTQLSITDGYGIEQSTEKIFLLSRAEVYGGVERSADGTDGTVYEYYGAGHSGLTAPGTGADTNRIKYTGGSATYWWLRTPYSSDGNNVRSAYPTGELYDISATKSIGVAPACVIV